MSLNAFLQWEAAFPRRFEFVDGRPIHRRDDGSGGESVEVRTGMLTALHDRARANGLEITVDERIQCKTGNVRYVDAQLTRIAGGRFPDGECAVIDLLPSDFAIVDFVDRMTDFDSVVAIRAYLVVVDDRIRCMQFVRQGVHLVLSDVTEDKTATVSIPPFGLPMKIGEFYAAAGELGLGRSS